MSHPQAAYIEKWVGFLNAVDREMSVMAAQKLSKVRDESVVAELINALTQRPDDVRTAAARSLGDIGDARAVPALMALLDDSNSVLASAAADSLGKIGSEQAVPPLVQILKDYKDGRTRHNQLHGFDRGLYMAAVYALQKIGSPKALSAVKKYHR